MKTNVLLILLTVAACVLASMAFIRVGQIEKQVNYLTEERNMLAEDMDQAKDELFK